MYKLPMLREALFDWFVDFRRSVQGSVGPAFVRMQAQAIASKVIRLMASRQVVLDVPKIDAQWVRRWCADNHVCLRNLEAVERVA